MRGLFYLLVSSPIGQGMKALDGKTVNCIDINLADFSYLRVTSVPARARATDYWLPSDWDPGWL